MKNKLVMNGKFLGLDPNSYVISHYHCEACGNEFSSNKGVRIHCPNCGGVSKATGEKIEASKFKTTSAGFCVTCSSELHSDEEIKPDIPVFCPECGDQTKLSESQDEEIDTEITDNLSVKPSDEEDLDSEELSDLGTEASDDDSEDSEENSEDNIEDSEDLDIDEDSEGEEGEREESEDEEASAMVKAVEEILEAPIKEPEDVKMDVWEDDKGVRRNVTVSGIPIAQIHLADQPEPEKMQEIFKDEVYVDSLKDSMMANPVKKVLQEVNARFFTFSISEEVPKEKEVAEKVKAALDNFRSKFKETFLAVVSGVNKNIFPDIRNSLKYDLWEALAEEGIEQPQKLIEPIFEKSLEPFIDQTFDKTMELLNKPEDTRKTVLQTVIASGVVPVESEEEDAGTLLKKRLAKGSVSVVVGGLGKNVRNQVREQVSFLKNRQR